jgi:hypothetical protein
MGRQAVAELTWSTGAPGRLFPLWITRTGGPHAARRIHEPTGCKDIRQSASRSLPQIQAVAAVSLPTTLSEIRKISGSPSRTRTCDKAINSRLLYQLSYRGSRGGLYTPRLSDARGLMAIRACTSASSVVARLDRARSVRSAATLRADGTKSARFRTEPTNQRRPATCLQGPPSIGLGVVAPSTPSPAGRPNRQTMQKSRP